MEKLIPNGPPSLLHCKKLVVEGHRKPFFIAFAVWQDP